MRFVKPETVRLTLPDGNWLDVKKELTVAEDMRLNSAGFTRMSGAGGNRGIDIDWLEMGLAKVETYVVDWSAKNDSGKDVPITRATIENLAPEDFKAISDAIDAHIEAMVQEKKVRDGISSLTPA